AVAMAATRNGAAWGDYDRDGDLDLAVTGGGLTRVYRNNNGTFLSLPFVFQGLTNGVVAWGDYDNDGDLDLLVSGDKGSLTPFTALYRNDGNDVFTVVTSTLPALSDSAAAWGDFDGDGDLDLLFAGLGSSSAQAAVYRNNGDGTFTVAASLAGVDHASVAWGDYDNDGRLDALVAGVNSGGYVVQVYHNNGSGSFTAISLPLQGVASGGAQWADYNGDGFIDILVSGCTASNCASRITRIYRNNHDGTFADTDPGLNAVSGFSGAWGDFDNDGDLDLFLDRLYRNNSPFSNAPPSAPSGLVADLLPDNNVLLHWQAGADGTNNGGLNYSLRVGTAPGGVNYLSPHAGTDGTRRLPERGLANGTVWFLRDVPRGIYYWSVQTIDAGLAGSAFSAQNTFTITNARPVISAVANQLAVPGRPTPPIPFTVSDFETAAGSLTVNGSSSNTNLVPPAGLLLAGSGTNRTIKVSPAPHLSGTTTITLTVADAGGLVATSRFDIVVQAFSDAAAACRLRQAGQAPGPIMTTTAISILRWPAQGFRLRPFTAIIPEFLPTRVFHCQIAPATISRGSIMTGTVIWI
ncbi:MAG: regulatory domain of in-like proprotein convertase, partial [Pedosphaera sp.]|nr:regulatory domain of in-like proprotein convertase [Pedosphaera sp.]